MPNLIRHSNSKDAYIWIGLIFGMRKMFSIQGSNESKQLYQRRLERNYGSSAHGQSLSSIKQILLRIRHLSIDHCVQVYNMIKPGGNFDFMRLTSHCYTLERALRKQAIHRYLVKHPYDDRKRRYRDASHKHQHTSAAKTLKRMEPLMQTSAPYYQHMAPLKDHQQRYFAGVLTRPDTCDRVDVIKHPKFACIAYYNTLCKNFNNAQAPTPYKQSHKAYQVHRKAEQRACLAAQSSDSDFTSSGLDSSSEDESTKIHVPQVHSY